MRGGGRREFEGGFGHGGRSGGLGGRQGGGQGGEPVFEGGEAGFDGGDGVRGLCGLLDVDDPAGELSGISGENGAHSGQQSGAGGVTAHAPEVEQGGLTALEIAGLERFRISVVNKLD
ncbi:MAG: hypothetical protein C0504_14600 [Candidatus Solibacter sp.]|nr:hypothetical protein [Candidatus Solibacter sp.]